MRTSAEIEMIAEAHPARNDWLSFNDNMTFILSLLGCLRQEGPVVRDA